MGQRARAFQDVKRESKSGFVAPLSIILNSHEDSKLRRQVSLWWYLQTVSRGQLQLDKLLRSPLLGSLALVG